MKHLRDDRDPSSRHILRSCAEVLNHVSSTMGFSHGRMPMLWTLEQNILAPPCTNWVVPIDLLSARSASSTISTTMFDASPPRALTALLLLLSWKTLTCHAFSVAYPASSEAPRLQQQQHSSKVRQNKNPFQLSGLDIEQPDFDSLFAQIQEVSPLARSVVEGRNRNLGLAAIVDDKKCKTIRSATCIKDQGYISFSHLALH